jgi:hypothetical protein
VNVLPSAFMLDLQGDEVIEKNKEIEVLIESDAVNHSTDDKS